MILFIFRITIDVLESAIIALPAIIIAPDFGNKPVIVPCENGSIDYIDQGVSFYTLFYDSSFNKR